MTLSRRRLLQTSAGVAAGTAILGAPAGAGAVTARAIRTPRLNAGTGGSPLTPRVARAVQAQIAPVGDPRFVELFTETTRWTADVLDTRADVLLFPGEAIVALEAAFRSLTRPGIKALNVISGVYGADYTAWLQAYGAEVTEVRVPFDASVDPAAVEAALAANPGIELVTVVHVDTPSGTANDVAAIGRIAKRHGAVTLVDAASTVGGMPLYPDRWGLDVVVGAAHKCLGSPVGFGITTVSDAAWKLVAANTRPPEPFSVLSLDAFRKTLAAGRVPSLVSPTVTYGYHAALEEFRRRGARRTFERTARAAAAFRAGARAAGVALWPAEGALPAETNSTVVLPGDATIARGLEQLRTRGVAGAGTSFTGERRGETIRLGHMGPVQTDPRFVVDLVGAVARTWGELGARTDPRAGERAARRAL